MLNIPYWAFGIMTLFFIAPVFTAIYLNLENVVVYNIFISIISVIIVAGLFAYLLYCKCSLIMYFT